MKIYDEYTSKIRSAANTSDLRRFTDKLAAKMSIRALNYSQEMMEIVKENDPEMLKILRDETQYIVMLMRAIIEEKKAQYSANGKPVVDFWDMYTEKHDVVIMDKKPDEKAVVQEAKTETEKA